MAGWRCEGRRGDQQQHIWSCARHPWNYGLIRHGGRHMNLPIYDKKTDALRGVFLLAAFLICSVDNTRFVGPRLVNFVCGCKHEARDDLPGASSKPRPPAAPLARRNTCSCSSNGHSRFTGLVGNRVTSLFCFCSEPQRHETNKHRMTQDFGKEQLSFT